MFWFFKILLRNSCIFLFLIHRTSVQQASRESVPTFLSQKYDQLSGILVCLISNSQPSTFSCWTTGVLLTRMNQIHLLWWSKLAFGLSDKNNSEFHLLAGLLIHCTFGVSIWLGFTLLGLPLPIPYKCTSWVLYCC